MKDLARWEKETIITFDEENDTAEVSTHNGKLKRALAKCSAKNNACYRKFSDDSQEVYICPKSYIKIRAPRELSEESKQKLADRARAGFAKANEDNDDESEDEEDA